LAAIACFAIFYLATAFALGFGTGTIGIARETFLGIQLFAILFLALGIIVSGFAADRFGAGNVLMVGCGLTLGVAAMIVPTLGSGQVPLIALFLSSALFAMGLVYGPLGAWLPGLFPARVRYSGASVAFNMAGILGGGLAPLIAQRLADQSGLGAVGVYLAACAGLSLIGLIGLRAKG
jgi:MFS family permease